MKTENELPAPRETIDGHVRAVLCQVQNQITALRSLEEGLRTFLGEMDADIALEQLKVERKPCTLYSLKQEDFTTGKRRRKTEVGEQLVAVTRKLTEPFTCIDLAETAKVAKKTAPNAILRWAARNWVQRVSFGHYARTKEFGGLARLNGERMLEEIHREIEAKKQEHGE